MSLRSDWVHMYVNELRSRIIAESAIPTDGFHLGKLILQGLRDDPTFILQIDGGTGKVETNASVLHRSVQCATWFRAMGLQRGDVVVLLAPNHLDLAIPFYAALYLGIIIAPIDGTLEVAELQHTFEEREPKIIFCQRERQHHVEQALNNLKLCAKVITFDEGANGDSFSKFLEKYVVDVQSFRPDDFDPAETIAVLVATSGTTGLPKCAAITHKNFALTGPYIWCTSKKLPSPTRSVLIVAPLQWSTTIFNFILSVYLKYCRVQSSLPTTPDHIYEIINKHKPTFLILSPTMMTTLLTPGEREKCDFTCFERIYLGGSAVHPDLIKELKEITPKTEVGILYGMSELTTLGFEGLDAPPGSCGKQIGCMEYKLVNTETGAVIDVPNVPGELWVKGPGIVKSYYKNPKATAEAFTKDGWFQTGDIFYRDENWNYFFYDRLKLLLKYRNHQISPVEVESVIRQHPGVMDIAVTGVPHHEFGDLVVACVVPRPDWTPNAQEIKDLVKESLTDTKQLRGGVVFMKQLPLTTSTKINRMKLKQMVQSLQRE